MRSDEAHTNDILDVKASDGRWEVWASVWNQGLARWDGKEWKHIGLRDGFPLRNPTGLAATADSRGRQILWASTYDAGVAWFDGT